jgi:2-oxoglutarate dehydrogenase E2 component (dihydrolipoamide succinyltransferase)
MRIEVLVPNLPESVSDATLLDWHHKAGESVSKDANLIDLETDKVILEVPVPESGILQEVRRSKGDVVSSGDVLAVIDTEANQDAAAPPMSAAPSSEQAALQQTPPEQIVSSPSAPQTRTPATAAAYSQPVSPTVRRLLREHQLEPADIPVTGRITKQDVLNFLEQQTHSSSLETGPASTAPTARSRPTPLDRPSERRVPMTRIRARIAERMQEAQRSTATLTTFNEINLRKVFELRNAHRALFEKTHQVKLGLMSFFVKASIEALKRFPIINASAEGQDIVYHDYFDIGIAVTTERGLVVPVLRDADKLGFAEIEKAINDYSIRGRDGKLSFEELAGGTFTITNGGIFGSMLSTPILNPPQSAILGMHAIKDRPVVEDGQIVIRPIIYLALSYDHRIIDGREAVSFLFTVKELLEDPSRLLLGV